MRLDEATPEERQTCKFRNKVIWQHERYYAFHDGNEWRICGCVNEHTKLKYGIERDDWYIAGKKSPSLLDVNDPDYLEI